MADLRLDDFVHVDGWLPDDELRTAVDRSVDAAVAALGDRPLPDDPSAADRASAEALAVAREAPVSDVRDEPALSAALVMHRPGLPGSLHDDTVVDARREVDHLLTAVIRDIVGRPVELSVSGHFWYPPNTGMGWHTNHARPGWRAYVTRADRPAASWFRYADPVTGDVITSLDGTWDLRMFRIDEREPFWHAVWSGCHRHSFGYHVTVA